LKSHGPEDSQTLEVLDDLSVVYDYRGKSTEAIALAQQVRDALVKKHGADHYLAILSLNSLASRYSNGGKMGKALALFEEARDGIVPRLGTENRTSLMILDNLAHMYRAYGRTTEAVALAEQVRDARVMTLGIYHPDTINTMDNLGAAYQADGKPEKALAMFQQAAAGLEKHDFAHVAADLIVWHLCDFLEEREQFDKADVWRRKWLDAAKKMYGPDSAAYAEVLAKQGEYMLRRKRYANAEPILRESLSILQKKQPEAPRTFLAQSVLGAVLLEQKRLPDAEPLLIQGYEGLKAREKEISPLYAKFRIAEAGQRIVRLYESWGRPEKAEEWRTKLPVSRHAMPKQ
jgi:tetratricopeptide (TPR) repeat protein